MFKSRLFTLSLVILLLVPRVVAAKSHDEYLAGLRATPFHAWHFMQWSAVTHPIDYWIEHSRIERKEAHHKIRDFLTGKEFMPEGFSAVKIPAGELKLDGALHLAGETERPLIVMIPGTFGSHLSSYISDTASLMAKSGRFHVLLLASRMSSTTMAHSKTVGSGGYLEGQDILAAVRWLRQKSPWSLLVSKVGLYGVSLSGDYLVHAMAADREGLIDAGLIVSGVYELQALSREIDEKAASPNIVRYAWAHLFHKYLRAHVNEARENLGLKLSDDEIEHMGLADYAAKVAWPVYSHRFQELFGAGFSLSDLIRLSTSLDLVPKIHAPLLAIHSHEDSYLGFSHADRFAEAARANPNVALEYVDRAQHANYFIHDPAWFAQLLETYYAYWLL